MAQLISNVKRLLREVLACVPVGLLASWGDVKYTQQRAYGSTSWVVAEDSRHRVVACANCGRFSNAALPVLSKAPLRSVIREQGVVTGEM